LTQNYNYDDFDFFNKVKSLIENIKKKNILNINEKIDLKGISIYPRKNLLFDNIITQISLLLMKKYFI